MVAIYMTLRRSEQTEKFISFYLQRPFQLGLVAIFVTYRQLANLHTEPILNKLFITKLIR